MTFVGLDPSLQAFGMAILAPEGYATHVLRPRSRGPQRLDVLTRSVRQLMPAASMVAIEGYSYGHRAQVQGMLARAELVGCLRVALWGMSRAVVTIAPTQLKLYATGKGNAQKADVIQAVRDRWGVDLRTSDAADAYVLARLLRDAHTGERGWCRKAEGVLEAVRRQLEEVA